jgi:hypothetical protein
MFFRAKRKDEGVEGVEASQGHTGEGANLRASARYRERRQAGRGPCPAGTGSAQIRFSKNNFRKVPFGDRKAAAVVEANVFAAALRASGIRRVAR